MKKIFSDSYFKLKLKQTWIYQLIRIFTQGHLNLIIGRFYTRERIIRLDELE